MVCCADALGNKSEAAAAPTDTTGLGASGAFAVPGVLADSLPGARGFPVVGVVVSLGVREPDLRDERPAGEGLVGPGGLRARARVGGVARLAAFSKSSTWSEAGLLLLPPTLPLSWAVRDLHRRTSLCVL